MESFITKINHQYLYTNNEEVIYIANLKPGYFRFVKQIFQDNKILVQIRIKFKLPFQINYLVEYSDNHKIIIKPQGAFKPLFIFSDDSNNYQIIKHKGSKTSIFKNGTQIAYYEKDIVNFFEKETIKIIADEDIDHLLIFSIILALDCHFNTNNTTATIDFGNLSPELKSFDSTWKPKKITSF